MSIDQEKARAIFLRAVEQYAPTEWKVFLDGACGDDAALRRRVELLLKAHQGEDSFLDRGEGGATGPRSDQATQATAAPKSYSDQVGTQIGPYKLLQQIGEGGMGVVYMAEQTQPMQRRVALKIIKPGMDSRQVIARFEAERQALAMMDHPNIAKVLDAGTTETGRPYFVMELVKGVPITRYCDDQHLTPRERMELFIPVCQAVQHAHQKGIIHRDLKPSNILMALVDGKPVPKVIDFGVAKATHQRLTEKTMFTEYGQIVGTLEYMSPEQARLDQLDIDTRSDIYSLGVLLYELLTGATPFDRQRLRSAAFDELLRIIREEEPPKPSTRLSTIETLPNVAANRRIEPQKLSSLLRGDLDWIVMKALEKDRARRYETANGLAADLQRFLNDEPVTACPPSAGYRFRKFARRNKAALATGSLVAVALVAGIILSTWQAVRATRAERLAQERLVAEERAHREADEARQEAEAARNEALAARNEALAARDTEKQAREEAETQKQRAETALTQAEAERTRAEANFALARSAVDEYLNKVTENELLRVPGMQQLRQDLLSSALTFYGRFGNESGEDLELRRELASAQYRLGSIHRELGDFTAANMANARAIQGYESLRSEGHGTPEIERELARAFFAAGRYEQTASQCKKILESEPQSAELQSLLAEAYHELASQAGKKKNVGDELRYHQQAFALRDALVREFPDNATYLAGLAGTVNNLGVLLANDDKYAEALAMYERGMTCMTRACELAPQNIQWGKWLAIGLRNVANMQRTIGQQEAALATSQRYLAERRRLVSENPHVAALRGDLGEAYFELAGHHAALRQDAEAARMARLAREVLENTPHDTPEEMFQLATIYGNLAQPASGEQDEALRNERQRHADLAMDMLRKAVDAGYRDAAALKSSAALQPLRAREEFATLVDTVDKLARSAELVQSSRGTDAAAAEGRQQALELVKEVVAREPDNLQRRRTYATTLRSIGELQTGLKQFSDAEKSLTESIGIWRELEAADTDQARERRLDRIAAEISLGELYLESARGAEAERLWQTAQRELEAFDSQAGGDARFAALVAAHERRLCGVYARIGAWELAATYPRRNVQLNRVARTIDDVRFSKFLWSEEADADFREFCRRCESQRAGGGGRVWSDSELQLLAWVSCLVDPPVVPPQQCIEWCERLYQSAPTSYFNALCLALARHRAGEHATALELLKKYDGSVMLDAFVVALAAKAAGQEELARSKLEQAESRYVRFCQESLALDKPGFAAPFQQAWSDVPALHVLRRQAWRVVAGREAVEEGWRHLLEARGLHFLGRGQQRDAQLAAAVPEGSIDVNVLLGRARLLHSWNESARAELDAQRIIELTAEDPAGRVELGRMYVAFGRDEQALPLLEEGLTSLRNRQPFEGESVLELVYDLACVYDNLGQWENALKLRREALTQTREHAGSSSSAAGAALHVLACDNVAALPRLVAEARRNPDNAVSIARREVDLDLGISQEAIAQRNLAVTLFRAGRDREAVEVFEKSQSAGTGSEAAWFSWAMAQWRLGNEEVAREIYGQGAAWLAERPRPRNQYELEAEAERLMGLDREERYHLALAFLDKAIGAGSRNAALYRQRAMVRMNQGLIEASRPDLEKAVDLDPANAENWSALIELHLRQKDLTAARAALEQAVRALKKATASESFRLADRLWWVAVAGREALGAEETPARFVESALGVKPETMDREALFQHAAWLLRTGEHDRFAAACQLLAAQPYREVRENYLLARLGSLAADSPIPVDDLLTAARIANGREGGRAWVQHALGMCLLRAGRNAEAIEQLRSSAERHDHYPGFNWVALAIAYHHAGREAAARTWLEKGRKWCDQGVADIDFGLHPHERISFELLLREAELLIEPEVAAHKAPYVFPETPVVADEKDVSDDELVAAATHGILELRALMARAEVLERRGEAARGLAIWKKAADLLPMLEATLTAAEKEQQAAGTSDAKRAMLHRMRAKILARNDRLEPAAADLNRAVELEPENLGSWCELARVLLRLDRDDELKQCIARAVAVVPAAGAGRGGTLLRLCDAVWSEAVMHPEWLARRDAMIARLETIFAVDVAQGNGDPPAIWYQHACWLLYSGCRDRYQALCRTAFANHAADAGPWLSYLLSRLAALDAQPPVPSEEYLALAEASVAAKSVPGHVHALGLSLLRAGRANEAYEPLQRSAEVRHFIGVDWLCLALVCHQLGRLDEARQFLLQGKRWCDSQQVTRSESWIYPHERLAALILLREAERVIETTPPPTAATAPQPPPAPAR